MKRSHSTIYGSAARRRQRGGSFNLLALLRRLFRGKS